MEKYTLILFVMPIILLSVIIAFSFIIQRLTSIAKTPILQVVTMIILYIVYAYVTLKFPYNLLGFIVIHLLSKQLWPITSSKNMVTGYF